MHVPVLRRRGPFVGYEGCEFPRLVILVSNSDYLLPDITSYFRADQFFDRRVLENTGTEDKGRRD